MSLTGRNWFLHRVAPTSVLLATALVDISDRVRLLAGVALFKGLSPTQLLPLALVAEPILYRPCDSIVRQGDPGESVYVITEGKVDVLARSENDPDAPEAVVAWLGAGDAVGELSLLDGQPRSASCVAVEDTLCLRLDRQHFKGALQEHWALTEELLMVLAQRLRLADKLLAEHARDPLTGLNNRRALAKIYARGANRAQRGARRAERVPLAVLFADVDNFKQINDSHGHMVGDNVLRSVAQTLTAVSRDSDVVARFGGDEFVMLLPEAGEEGASLVASRVREILSDQPPGPVPFSVSIGTAVYDVERPPSFEELLAAADSSMYQDKNRAKNN